jgi:hypothetical protein
MAPFAIVAIVAAGLIGTGTIIKDKEPVIGTVMQGAGVGALVGGGLGAVAGTAAGTASVLGTTGVVSTVTSASLIGGSSGAFFGGLFSGGK